jgi:hypothetical protein
VLTTRPLRAAAALGVVAALISIVTSLAVPAGLMSNESSPTSNTIDLLTDVLLVLGLTREQATNATLGV